MSRRRLVGWGLGGGILLVLLVTLDTAAIGSALGTADLALVVPAVIGLAAVHLIGAVTWRELTRRLAGLTIGWRSAVLLSYAAQALGGLTPANIGSDAYRAVALRDGAEGTASVVLPIVVQRATSYLALSLVGLVSLLIISVPADIPIGLVVVVVAIAGAVLGGAGLGWLLRHPEATVVAGRGALAQAMAIGLGGGLAFHLAAIGLGALLVLAVDPASGGMVPAVLAAVAVARVSLLVPLTPSGLGVGEAALAILFTGIGLAAETAIAASLLARLGLVLTTLLGSAALAGSSHPSQAWSRRPAEPEGRAR